MSAADGSAASAPPPSAAGDGERYVVERLLGQGAMGAVHLVRDRETGERLAIKKLFRMDGRSLLRLKREFRAVADMSHPNLVKVYELGHAVDGYFLAMEYVPGEDFQSYLGQSTHAQSEPREVWLQQRMLPAFQQLAQGVNALHRAGMLHRDLKPSNVLVAADQRVVVLDFGLVRELDPAAPKLTEDGAIAGTPAYMAPEQALCKPLSEATDWYAFGVMLYETITGVLPHEGSLAELLRDKLERDPVRPDAFDPDIPKPLSELCMALLSRDPQQRPSGSEVLARLLPARPAPPDRDARTGETTIQTETSATTRTRLFGRRAELETLSRAMRAAEAGQSQVVHVRGMSGSGKSSLVEHFLDDLDHQSSLTGQAEALVLRSRCYEREAMPFKALDGVVDALTRQLSHMDDVQVGHLLPADIDALVQLFPVLERLRAVQRLFKLGPQSGTSVHNRQRAELALRDLFSRLAARRPVLIWIDDLQWGDLDSAAILKGFLQRTLELPFMLLLSYRSDEVETSECLRLLLSAAAQPEAGAPTTVLQVSELAAPDMFALCREQLGGLAHGREALIEHIVRESDGSPFLAGQLTALALAKLARGEATASALSLSNLVEQTAALLPTEARHFLAVLAIAGRPIAPKLALRAAGLRHGGREIIHALRRQLLVRTRDVAGDKLIEVYHDRVRASVQRAIPEPDSERIHASLLHALEYSGRADPDQLYAHALGAKQPVAAFRYGLAAAERAMATLAFEHAATLYRSCLALSETSSPQGHELVRKLAEALACCGRGGAAADAYLQASALASGSEAVGLMRLATSHLFRSGRFDEAETMLERVLAAMGERMPSSPTAVILGLFWERLRLALRGLRFTLRSQADVSPAVLERIDSFRDFRADLQAVDPLRSMWFNLRVLRWALDAGDPMRLLESLGGLCNALAMRGTPAAERRSQQLLDQITALANQVATPAARALLLTTQAMSCWARDRLQEVLAPSYEAERLLRQNIGVLGGYYARSLVVSARIVALYRLGDCASFATQLRAAVEEAQATQNRTALLNLTVNRTLLDEIEDRADEAVTRLEEERQMLPKHGFSAFHALHLIAVCSAASASGRYAWGRHILDEDWPRLLRSPLKHTSTLRFGLFAQRIRLLLNQHFACDGADTVPLSRLRGEITAFARAQQSQDARTQAAAMRARIEIIDGNRAAALRELQNGAGGNNVPAHAARYAQGMLLGGDEGKQLCSESEATLRMMGVVNSLRVIRSHYPELFPADRDAK